ncbi:MAG: TetR family transcriptional regulator [Pseudomonadota bacterium]
MQERRQKILDATLEVLAQNGLAHLTHRAIDAHAGLPAGSTSYYFSKKADLIAGAADHLVWLMEDDCRLVKERFAELIAEGRRDDAIDYVADDLLEYGKTKSDWLLARFELTLAGVRTTELRPIADQLSAAAQEPIAFFLKLLSSELSTEQVEACMGILDGLALIAATGQGPAPTKDQIKRLFLSV